MRFQYILNYLDRIPYFNSFQKRLGDWVKSNSKESVGFIFFMIMLLIANYTIIAKKSFSGRIAIQVPVLLGTAEGLSKGAFVYCHGVKIGYLASLTPIKLDAKSYPISFKDKKRLSYGQGIIAILNLDRNLIFYPNYRVITKNRTVLADKIIEILPGDSQGWDKKLLPGVPFLWPDGTPQDKAVVIRKMEYKEVITFTKTGYLEKKDHLLRCSNYDDPLYLFSSILAENRQNVKYIFQDLRKITGNINNGKGTIGALINKPSIEKGINKFLEEFIYFLHDIRDGAEALRETDSAIRIITVSTALVFWYLTQ